MGGKRWEGNLTPRRRTNAVPYTLVHKATLVSSRTKADADASKGTERYGAVAQSRFYINVCLAL